jgi:hypothetical protein
MKKKKHWHTTGGANSPEDLAAKVGNYKTGTNIVLAPNNSYYLFVYYIQLEPR